MKHTVFHTENFTVKISIPFEPIWFKMLILRYYPFSLNFCWISSQSPEKFTIISSKLYILLTIFEISLCLYKSIIILGPNLFFTLRTLSHLIVDQFARGSPILNINIFICYAIQTCLPNSWYICTQSQVRLRDINQVFDT